MIENNEDKKEVATEEVFTEENYSDIKFDWEEIEKEYGQMNEKFKELCNQNIEIFKKFVIENQISPDGAKKVFDIVLRNEKEILCKKNGKNVRPMMLKKSWENHMFIHSLLAKAEPFEYLIEQTEDGKNIYLIMKIYDCKVDRGQLGFDLSIVKERCREILDYIKGTIK